MGGSVEEDDGEDVQVPHAVDPREESTVDLESVVSAVPVAFTDLVKNKKSWNVYQSLNVMIIKPVVRIYMSINRGDILTWFNMNEMTVMAAHARVTSIKNLNLKMIPWKPARVEKHPGCCFIHCINYLYPNISRFTCDSDVKTNKSNLVTQSSGLWHRRKLL